MATLDEGPSGEEPTGSDKPIREGGFLWDNRAWHSGKFSLSGDSVTLPFLPLTLLAVRSVFPW